MQNLSDKTREVVRQLYELDKTRSWFGQSSRDEISCQLLSELTVAAEYRTVVCCTLSVFAQPASTRIRL